ncbi:MAG TPA: UvrD-helicase domain-containing protein, partial [Acidimicrobiales bacterium]|nr:UvrD-helicase domain-containing protein [Acidimicrobiales bacterium]
MELTAGQRRVVVHAGGRLRVVGGAGSGKTTALLVRYRRLVSPGSNGVASGEPGAAVRASSVLVLCRTRGAAGRFRDAVLPHLAGGFDALPITTFFGLAYDLVSRHSDPVSLLTGAEQRHLVGRLLATENPADWPTLGHLLGRPALVGEVADGLLLLHSLGGLGGPGGPGHHPWPELVAFAERYRRALDDDDRLDASGLLARAADLLADPIVAAAERRRIGHVLVDDYEAATPPMAAILDRLPGDVAVAGDPDGACGGFPGAHRRHLVGFEADIDVDLSPHCFRQADAPVLISTRHPSVEPEAVAGELLAAHAAGVAWSDMAVLVRRPRQRARAITRGLARHGIPAQAPAAAVRGDDPVVGSVVDMLRWVDGDPTALDRLLVSPLSGIDAVEARRIRRLAREAGTPLEGEPRLGPLVELRDHLVTRATTDSPADLAFQVWQRGLAHLVDTGDSDGEAHDDDVLDGLVAFLDGLQREADRNPRLRLPDLLAHLDAEGSDGATSMADPWRVSAAATGRGADAVAVTSILEGAGREWHTVVIAGCVEGELPSLGNRDRLFDLDPPDPASAAERRRQTLAEERRLFAMACSRATTRLIATAGPEPGVLLSRFVEGWDSAEVRIPAPPGRAPAFRRPTVNPLPIVTDAGLALSASQLDTYDDCPLRYAYRYVLRVRDEGGVRADLGTLVHEVLARFLDPAEAGERPRTRDGLMGLAEDLWRHDIARYRPQVEEARRDFFAMLDTWWQFEGQGQLAPDV